MSLPSLPSFGTSRRDSPVLARRYWPSQLLSRSFRHILLGSTHRGVSGPKFRRQFLPTGSICIAPTSRYVGHQNFHKSRFTKLAIQPFLSNQKEVFLVGFSIGVLLFVPRRASVERRPSSTGPAIASKRDRRRRCCCNPLLVCRFRLFGHFELSPQRRGRRERERDFGFPNTA